MAHRFLLFALFGAFTLAYGLDIAASGPSSVAYIADSEFDARVYSAVSLDDVVLFSYSTNGRNYYSTYSLNEDGAPFRLLTSEALGKEGVSSSFALGDDTVLSAWFTQGEQQIVQVVSVQPTDVETRNSQSISIAAPESNTPTVGTGAGMIFYATNSAGQSAQARCIEVSNSFDVQLSTIAYDFPTSGDVYNVQVFPINETDVILSYWSGRHTIVTFAHREQDADACGIVYTPVIAFAGAVFSAVSVGEKAVLCTSVKCLLCDREGVCENLEAFPAHLSASVSVAALNDTHIVRAKAIDVAAMEIVVEIVDASDLAVVASTSFSEDCACTQLTVVRFSQSIFFVSYRRNETGELVVRVVRADNAGSATQQAAEEADNIKNSASDKNGFAQRKTVVIATIAGVIGTVAIAAIVVAVLLFRKARRTPYGLRNAEDRKMSIESPTDRILFVEHDTITFAESIEDRSARSSRAPSEESILPVLPENQAAAPPSPVSNHSTLVLPYSSLIPQNKIGDGSLGEVMRMRYRDLSYAEVAVKMVDTSKVKKIYQEQMTQFMAEAEVMTELPPHQNVIAFFGLTVSPDPFSIVLEYCERSLHTLLRDRTVRLSDEDNLTLAKDIARGVLHLHIAARADPATGKRRPVIHRDLATRNIMMKDDKAAVSDYGLAIIREGTAAAGNTSSDGPMKWVAPEVMLRKDYSVKSDAFSYGVVLYEIITRDAPWPGYDAVNAAMAVVRGVRMEIPENCNPVLANVMEQCWMSNPADRPDFEQILTMLEEEVTTGPESEFDSE